MANDTNTMLCRVQVPTCSFPSAFDSLINPLSSDYLNLPPHDVQHAITNDILLALEKTLGIGVPFASRFNTNAFSVSATNVVSLASDIPTATTIGTAYIYRAGGTDVPIADGGTNASSFAQTHGLIYYDGLALVADTAALTATYIPVATADGRLTNSPIISDGVNGLTGLYAAISVKTSTYNVLATDTGTTFTNEGASAIVPFNLPTAVACYKYTFIIQDSDGIKITAAADDTIRLGGTVSKTAGYISSTTIGDTVTLISINATEWIAISFNGTWTIEQ